MVKQNLMECPRCEKELDPKEVYPVNDDGREMCHDCFFIAYDVCVPCGAANPIGSEICRHCGEKLKEGK